LNIKNIDKKEVTFWVIILLSVLINIGLSVIVPAMPLIIRDEFDDSFLTLVFFALLFSRFVASNFVGKLLCYIPAHKLLLFGLILHAITMGMFTFANTQAEFIFLRALEGVFEGISTVILQYYVISLSNDKSRGRMMGVYASSIGLGFIFGSIIGGLLVKFYGLNGVFIGTMILMFIGVSILLFAYKTLQSITIQNKVQSTKEKDFSLLAEVVKYLPYYSGALVQRGLFIAFSALLPLYLVDNFELEVYNIGYYFTISAIITSIMMPWTGRFSDKYEASIITYLSLCLMSISIAGFSFATNEIIFNILFVIETIAFAFMAPAAMNIFSSKVSNSNNQEQVIATVSSARDIVAMLVVVLVLPLYSISPVYAWFTLSFLTLISAAPYIMLSRARI